MVKTQFFLLDRSINGYVGFGAHTRIGAGHGNILFG
jgi:hypothetical protein